LPRYPFNIELSRQRRAKLIVGKADQRTFQKASEQPTAKTKSELPNSEGSCACIDHLELHVFGSCLILLVDFTDTEKSATLHASLGRCEPERDESRRKTA
jgi:hypothetical protein